MSNKNYVAICSNCGRSLEICRDNFPEELKHEAQVMGKWVKRKPLPDGSLPMTSEELREFNKIVADFIKRFFQITYQNRVKIYEDKVCLVFKHDYTRDEHLIFVSELKAILYLATLFDLEVK